MQDYMNLIKKFPIKIFFCLSFGVKILMLICKHFKVICWMSFLCLKVDTKIGFNRVNKMRWLQKPQNSGGFPGLKNAMGKIRGDVNEHSG